MRLLAFVVLLVAVLAKDYKSYSNLDCPGNDIHQEKTQDVALQRLPNSSVGWKTQEHMRFDG